MDSLEYFKNLGENFPNLKMGKMFGANCYKAPNGKAVAMWHSTNLVVKLPPTVADEELHAKGSVVFEPMPGKPMNGWIVVAEKRKKDWQALLAEAEAFVGALPASVPKKKK